MKSLPWSHRQRELLAWYDSAKRDLPWRKSADSYAITVSEFMLQQTQVITVIPYYRRWLLQFPNWQALSEASPDQVLKAWEGLGYYTRARNLHAVAKKVAETGGFPREYAQLRSLPGLGPYTAAAVASIAFGLPFAALDGNVMRVLTRLEAIIDPIDLPGTKRTLQAMADTWLKSGLEDQTVSVKRSNIPGDHNQAVMELGATLCLPRKPQCLICPLNEDCRGRFDPESYPVKNRAISLTRAEKIAVIYDDSGRVLCQQVAPNQAWAGLWRFPNFDDENMEAMEAEPTLIMKYGITKYRVTLNVVRARLKQSLLSEAGAGGVREQSPQFAPAAGSYYSLQELDKLALAAPHRKVLEKIGLEGK